MIATLVSVRQAVKKNVLLLLVARKSFLVIFQVIPA